MNYRCAFTEKMIDDCRKPRKGVPEVIPLELRSIQKYCIFPYRIQQREDFTQFVFVCSLRGSSASYFLFIDYFVAFYFG